MIDSGIDWTVRQLADFLAQHLHCTAAEAEASISNFFMAQREKLSPLDDARVAAIVASVRAEIDCNAGIPTYLENHILDVARRRYLDCFNIDLLRRYERRCQSSSRYHTWQQRQELLRCLKKERIAGSELDPRQMLYSQGAGEVFRWRGVQCFKTVFDVGILALLIDELKPRTIIELGAGRGGSAMLMADLATIAGVMINVHAVDLQVPDASAHEAIIFHAADCVQWLRENYDREYERPLLVVEDFHGELGEASYFFTRMLRKGDYLVIEDSMAKQDALGVLAASGDYLIDTRLTDYFGINCSSAINGILVRD